MKGLIGMKGLRKDLDMIFATVLGWKVRYMNEEI